MKRLARFSCMVLLSISLILLIAGAGFAARMKTDTLKTSAGDLVVIAVGHGSIVFKFQGKVIHVDPWSRLADYSKMPKADLILITHHHRDHLDLKAIKAVQKASTKIVGSAIAVKKLGQGQALKNGQSTMVLGLKIEAVPTYNLVNMRKPGVPFHLKGEGNGYVITFGDKRVYVAGDTENTPEMKALKDIYAAFLPMNLPYTMTPAMVADAARAMRPRILYPYHFDKSDTDLLKKLLSDLPQIQVRVMTFSR